MINVTAFRIALALAALLAGSPACLAASSAKLRVSATIPPYVSLNATQRVTSYQVRSEDLQRGYVDVPGAVTLSVRSNLTGGVPIAFDHGGSAQVLLRESGIGKYQAGSYTVSTAGFLPYTVITKSLDTRIMLPDGSREGTFPLALSVMSAL